MRNERRRKERGPSRASSAVSPRPARIGASVLVDELPAGIDLELDVYWASVAGRDPVELIRGHDERTRLLHMKDMSPDPDHRDVTPGDGILDWYLGYF